METRLKERLTGAAILVALIVLVVPELFHGQRPDVAANTSSGGEGPPVRSYTIDLSNGPARTAPLQSTDSAAVAANGTTPATSAADSAATTPVAVPGPAPAAPAAAAPIESGAAPGVPARTTGKTKAASASAASPTVAKSSSSAASAAASWSVQLGLFAQRDNAERMAHSAQTKGFSVGVSEADGKGLYHVLAGGLADRAAAQTLQGRLQGQGFPAALVAPQSLNLKSQR